jgi:hypothetical protein
MSKYYVYATGNSGHEPYEPLSNVDNATGEEITNPGELRRRVGPFFTCDGQNQNPHFHVVTSHPDIPNEYTDDLIMRQLHVPGFDQHNGSPKKGFATMPDFDIATGYHAVQPDQARHISEWREEHKFPSHVDNQDAFNQWREKNEIIFGLGGVRAEQDGTYSFHPGRTDEEVNQEPEEPEMPEQEEEEQEPEEQEENPAEKRFGIEPGEAIYNIVFHPGHEPKKEGNPYYPAFARSRVIKGHSNSFEAQNELLQNAHNLGIMKQMQDIRNLGADEDYWNKLFKRSNKSFDLWI